MIRLYFESILNKKRSSILLIGMLAIMALILFSANIHISKNEQLLNIEQYNNEFKTIFVLVEIMLVVIVLLLVLDHDESYQLPYIALVGRNREHNIKTIIFLGLTTFVCVIIFTMYVSIPYFMTEYYILDLAVLKLILSTYLSLIIMCLLSLVIIGKKRKPAVFIILLIYLLFTNINADTNNLTMFYTFPITNKVAISTKFGMVYQALYISGLYLLGVVYSNRRNLG